MFCISQKKSRRGNRALFTAAATLPSTKSFSESSQMPVLHSPYWGMGIYTTVLSRPSVTCLSGQAPGPQRPSSSASSPGFHMTSSVPSPSLRNRQEISLLVFSFPIAVCNPLDYPEKRFRHSGNGCTAYFSLYPLYPLYKIESSMLTRLHTKAISS